MFNGDGECKKDESRKRGKRKRGENRRRLGIGSSPTRQRTARQEKEGSRLGPGSAPAQQTVVGRKLGIGSTPTRQQAKGKVQSPGSLVSCPGLACGETYEARTPGHWYPAREVALQGNIK